MRQRQRPRTRRGFTLIELLTVTVIIGTLAAIAIPQYFRVKGKAYVTTMQSDLRNLATAEEMYFAEHGRYAANVTDLANFRISSGVRINISNAGLQGWYAVASHSASTSTCAIYVGSSAPAGAPSGGVNAGEGIPVCDATAAGGGTQPGERQP